MNAQQILQWIKDNRPDWVDSDKYQWLQWALQSSPNKQIVLESVGRDIQNGETDISQVNTNAEYNVNLNTQLSQRGQPTGAEVGTGQYIPQQYGGTGTPNQTQQPPTPSSSTWTSVQQMQDFINKGGNDQNVVSNFLGLSHPSWDTNVKGPKVDVKGLTQYVQSLPANEQKQALASIQQFLKDRSGWTPLQQKDLDDARSQAVRDVAASQLKPSTSVPSSGVDPSANLATVTTGATTPSQDQINQWQQLTGQDFETAYQNFINSQYVSVQQEMISTSGSVLTGNEQLWSAGGYQPISTTPNSQGWVWAFTSHPKSEALTPQEQQQSKGKNLQVTRGQFLGMMMASNQATTSKMGLVQATETAIQAKYGITLTPAEKQQIYNVIAPMSLQQLQSQVTAEGGGMTGWASAAIASTGVFGNLVTSLPEVAQNVAQANAITALQNGLGSNYAQYVTPDQIQALSKMSQSDQTNYINNLPDPTHPGFTVGAWNTGYGQILNDWQTNFGFSQKPSDSQITALMGMNTTQRTDYFNNSPSPVGGMNNLTYKNYDSTINNIRGDLTPSMGADFMASLANPSKTPVP